MRMKTLKRAIKWYLNLADKTSVWTPSCTIPYIKYKD